MPGTGRFDLDTLEFQVVRDMLTERLTTTLGRYAVDAVAPFGTSDLANRALRVAVELAERATQDDRPPLGGAVEVRSWLSRFFAGEHQVTTRDLAEIKRLLRATARCKSWLTSDTDRPELGALGATFPRVDDVVGELESVVDDRGEVMSSASVRLAEIRHAIDQAEGAVRTAAARFVADENVRRCLQTVEPAWRHGRPVFQVRSELRGKVPGVLHDRSQSGATVFIEPDVVVEAANRLSDACAAEHREIQVILTDVCRGLRRCRGDIEDAVASMENLDVATARARLIAEDGFHPAFVSESGPLRLRDAVHPILKRTHDPAEIVPLDITLNEPYSMLVITGPNTGGKTVVMKTVGLLSAMALAGVPLPAGPGSQIPLFDGIFADIGDEQGISQNLSTFSSHVTRIVRCLDQATERSLVLLDELGAGTDPEEGGALGYGVLEHLAKRRIPSVVTTHIGRLKQFAYEHDGADNGAMAFDGATLRPLYRLDVGIPGTSHALDIARRVGMPEALIERARALLGRRDARLEQVIERVQEARQKAEADRVRSERLNREAEQAGAAVERTRQEIEHQKVWLYEEADAFVEEQLRGARERIEPSLKSFLNAPRPYGEQARELLGELGDLLRSPSLHRRRMRFAGSVRKNAVVWVPRIRKRCVVKKVDRARELFTLEVGNLRLEVPFEDVSWLQPVDA